MADCDFEVVIKGCPLAMEGRMTAVLKNTGSRWLFEMVNFSMPAVAQSPGESYPGSAKIRLIPLFPPGTSREKSSRGP